jgi:hypothetical protein
MGRALATYPNGRCKRTIQGIIREQYGFCHYSLWIELAVTVTGLCVQVSAKGKQSVHQAICMSLGRVEVGRNQKGQFTIYEIGI